MKILMLVPFLPNTHMSGGQTRWYNIIKYLSKNHEITLYSLIKEESEKRFIPELKRYCKKVRVFSRPKSPWTARNILLTIFSLYPLLVVRNWSPKEKKALRKEINENRYDLIHAETFYVMPHIPDTQTPSILVEQTIEYQVYKHYVDNEVPFFLRPFFMIDVLKLKYWEQYFWKKTNRLVAVSEEDRKVMRELIPGIKVDIIPNGVDANHFASYKVPTKRPARVLYGAANFKWLQNVEAVEFLVNEIWPTIEKKSSDAILWVVGTSIPKKIWGLAAKNSRIEITESIPDVRDALKSATVIIVPVKGPGGTRLKMLEALAAGLPVVSTTVGAAGLDLKHNHHAMISDSPRELAGYTLELLDKPSLAKEIGKNGQEYVKKYFDWEVLGKLHDKIYKEITSS